MYLLLDSILRSYVVLFLYRRANIASEAAAAACLLPSAMDTAWRDTDSWQGCGVPAFWIPVP